MRGAPFIAQGGRFLPEINMETYGNRLMRIRSIFPPKLGPIGANMGRATLGFSRPPGTASRAAFCPGHCQVGPHLVYVSAGVLYVGFLSQMCPSCKCDAGCDLLCTFVMSCVCFLLVSLMGPCKPRFTKTYGTC